MTIQGLLLLVSTLMQAEVPAATDAKLEAERVEEALTITRDWAQKYEFMLGEDQPVELQKTPILKWSNPEQGSIHGNVFLWTCRQRPVAIGSLYQWFTPWTHMSHEFHSLADRPLTAERNGRSVWDTSAAGVNFITLENAPAVATNANGRMLQMRQLSRSLTATKRERDQTEIHELRLLPQPVYQYETTDDKPRFGALFTFVQGTDPEIIIWFEAQPVEGKLQWRVAFARLNGITLNVSQGDQEIWRADQMEWSAIRGHKDVYTTYSNQRSPID